MFLVGVCFLWFLCDNLFKLFFDCAFSASTIILSMSLGASGVISKSFFKTNRFSVLIFSLLMLSWFSLEFIFFDDALSIFSEA